MGHKQVEKPAQESGLIRCEHCDLTGLCREKLKKHNNKEHSEDNLQDV